MNQKSTSPIYVGVDWSTQELEVCVEDASGRVVQRRTFPGSGTGLADLAGWLLAQVEGQPERVRVAIEMSRGPAVETMLERGFAVFGINPKQVDRFRDRFSPAGAKDDRFDARVLADSLRTDPQAFRPLCVDAAEIIELREWSRIGDDLQAERVRVTNRLREQLRRYFPQALEITDDLGADWFLEVLRLLPSPEEAASGRSLSVDRILKRHRIRRITGEEILAVLRQPSVHVAPGTVEAATAHGRLLSDQLHLINEQLGECHRHLDRLCEQLSTGEGEESEEGPRGEQRDAKILRSFPGVGRVVLATLLAEAAQLLKARDYLALRSLAGIAPVTRKSGQREHVVMRRACQGRLRNAMYHWARTATQCDPVWKARYAALRQKGHGHGRACRGIADRLLAAAVAALRAGTLYDSARLTGSTRKVA